MYICNVCNKQFENPNSYSSHCKIHNNKNRYENSPKLCKECNNPLKYEQRFGKFCSHKCSTISSNRGTNRHQNNINLIYPNCKIGFKICDITNLPYCTKSKNGGRVQISPYIKSNKKKYYNDCQFKFNVYNYPKWFDLYLIEKYGWYTCPGKKRKNLKLNINGVSRDHLFSISLGYKLGIDSKIISHPANCILMLHKDNFKKFSKCFITILELIELIDMFNILYGAGCGDSTHFIGLEDQGTRNIPIQQF